ncbi:hypothetical protein A7A08_01696 [Methyloligella halotolerans]|uniref:HNH endonuclease n=1 Tax=Methyloligella halotolerans TaxID=1177755 RepID=A0A1E2RZM4_9HYPH|nr:HNH endonuclease [Methyloligella halotolerans]ODA67661.1 hypothetical protein A7A08_01696 [Methyloligella halotolerans]
MGKLSGPPPLLGGAPKPVAAPPERHSARERGYTSKWDRASKRFLRANPLCRGCQAVGRVEPATLTDHVIPHTRGTDAFWDQRWWQASCKWHHDVVKQLLEREFDAGRIGADDLWLDSDRAVHLTRRERGEGGR